MKHRVDLSKEYTTKSGLQVRLTGIDHTLFYPVQGEVLEGGSWQREYWGIFGNYFGDSSQGLDSRDLVEVKDD